MPRIPVRSRPLHLLHRSCFDPNRPVPTCFPIIQEIWAIIARVINNKRMTLAELLSITDSASIPQDLVSYTVRSASASGRLDCYLEKRSLMFQMSSFLSDRMNRLEYNLSLSDELNGIHRRLDMLISHMPTIGNYREIILRSFLAKYLPSRYRVATGFILGRSQSPKGQIDILIYDRLHSVPVFREGDLVVIPAGAVRAIIEVKSTLTSTEP